jgi:hypothetical protein
MKFLVSMFVAALLATAATGIGLHLWDGGFKRHDPTMRAIHYEPEAASEMSSRRRDHAN